MQIDIGKIISSIDSDMERTKQEIEKLTTFKETKIKKMIELFEETLKGLSLPKILEEKQIVGNHSIQVQAVDSIQKEK